MQRPPLLTLRQRELVPYLTAGCTRKEIADQLGISQDTVRLHVRNLLKQFGATNIRDCMHAMRDFEVCFGSSGPQNKIFYDEIIATLTIMPGGVVAKYTIHQKYTVVVDQVTEIIDLFGSEGDLLKVVVDDSEHFPAKYSSGLHRSKYVFDPPLLAGHQGNRSVSVLTENDFTEDTEWFAHSPIRPAGRLIFQVTVPPERPIQKIWGEVFAQSNFQEFEVDGLSADGCRVDYVVNDPIPGSSYKLLWDW